VYLPPESFVPKGKESETDVETAILALHCGQTVVLPTSALQKGQIILGSPPFYTPSIFTC